MSMVVVYFTRYSFLFCSLRGFTMPVRLVVVFADAFERDFM